MCEIEDTYFEDAEEALKVAREQNIFGPYQNLQLCYYNGDKISSECRNLIHMPSEMIVETLLSLNTRVPTKIDTSNAEEINNTLESFQIRKKELYYKLVKKYKETTLDFNDPLRVYISADYGGKVVLKVYDMLKNLFQRHGYEVFFQVNDELTYMDDMARLKFMLMCKPHITININRLRNNFLNEEVFNFIWFMDPTLSLFDDTAITLRSRDYIFYIGDEILMALKNKGVPDNKIVHQFLTPDYKIFHKKINIKKEKKIIFIGQNYFEVMQPTMEYKNHPVVEELKYLFNKNLITKKILKELVNKHKSSIRRPEHLETFIYPAVVRLETVKWMCMQSEIKAELYGNGWDAIKELSQCIKGNISNESELVDIINSAKYSLVAHSSFIYLPKLFESCSCDSIPVVYSGITTLDDFKYEDNALMFSNENEFREALVREPIKSPLQISDELSIETIVNKIQNIVNMETILC